MAHFQEWGLAGPFDLVPQILKMGVPSFAYFAKGGNGNACITCF
jgi:hypothetical protein